MYRDTVFSEMMKPSFMSSAWILVTRCAPAVLRHQPDEATDLGVDARSSRMPALGNPRPVSPEPIPMPPGYCIRVDDEQATRPPRPRLSKRDPESSVVVVEPISDSQPKLPIILLAPGNPAVDFLRPVQDDVDLACLHVDSLHSSALRHQETLTVRGDVVTDDRESIKQDSRFSGLECRSCLNGYNHYLVATKIKKLGAIR